MCKYWDNTLQSYKSLYWTESVAFFTKEFVGTSAKGLLRDFVCCSGPYLSRSFSGSSFASTQENIVGSCNCSLMGRHPFRWCFFLRVLCMCFGDWDISRGKALREGKTFLRNLKTVVWNSMKRQLKSFVIWVLGGWRPEGLFVFLEVYLYRKVHNF